HSGIWMSGAFNDTVVGCYIGTDVSGTLARPNHFDGIVITTGATSNTIGSTDPADGCIIGGNGMHGVEINAIPGSLVQHNYILGNDIGFNPSAGAGSAIANTQNGVFITGSRAIIQGNYIATNGSDGVLVFGGQNNLIASN